MRNAYQNVIFALCIISFVGVLEILWLSGLQDRITRLEQSDARASLFISRMQGCANPVIVLAPGNQITRVCMP